MLGPSPAKGGGRYDSELAIRSATGILLSP